jgi:hypothetical protein
MLLFTLSNTFEKLGSLPSKKYSNKSNCERIDFSKHLQSIQFFNKYENIVHINARKELIFSVLIIKDLLFVYQFIISPVLPNKRIN